MTIMHMAIAKPAMSETCSAQLSLKNSKLTGSPYVESHWFWAIRDFTDPGNFQIEVCQGS